MKKKIFEKKAEAYFTVEASFIIPLSIMIFVLIIYFVFFLYNHCLVTQSLYLAALRGQQLRNTSNSEIKKYVDEQLQLLLDEQVYQYQKDSRSEVNMAVITVAGRSAIENKMAKMGMTSLSELVTEKEKTIVRFYPAEYIRAIH